MTTKRNVIIGLVTIATFISCGLMASAAAPETPRQQIDYAGFLGLTAEIAEYREDRLIDLEAFNGMKTAPDTIILDARSAEAFEMGHIDGAINLNFSDFTDGKLAAVIPSTDTRILIYCNNNFSDNIAPVMVKRVELALNVPTFINLYGYGYENIYELGETVSITDSEVNWTGTAATLTLQEN